MSNDNILLYDFNQLVISSFVVASNNTTDISLNMVRHLILNAIIAHRKRFPDYKKVVVAIDSKNLWRKAIYPYYKAARKKNRKDSPIDWDFVYSSIDVLEKDFEKYFPYKVIRVDGAEADDIIATVIKSHKDDNVKIKIISTDKDFKQLQVFDYVSQFNPRENMPITEANPTKYLFEMFLKGDRGDGVPNFLSQDDSFVMSVRQKPLRQTKIEECWENKDPKSFCTEQQLEYYNRNKTMIDLVEDMMPQKLTDEILHKYQVANVGNKNDIINYFIEHKLRNLISDIQYL